LRRRFCCGLWLYALLQGVGSARQLARLVLEHDAYRWMSGGVQVNHHSLSDFRVAHGQALDELLSASLAALMTAGAVRLECVAQDGMRVRASAGAASFRRKASLQDNLELARKRVRELKEQIDADPAQDSRRKAAAQQRARREMQQRLQSALDRLPELEAIKRRNGSKAEEARASSTDADATVMKLADGGYRPAYNIQYAADCDSQLIVGVEVSTSGSDMAQLAPMVGQIEQRLGSAPQKMLVDGGYPAHAQIDAVADKTEVYAPVPEARVKKDEQGREVAQDNKHEPKPDDSAAVASWRQRMRQRAGAQPWPAAHAGSRPEEGSLRGTAAGAGAQPDAHAGTGAAVAGAGHNSVCSTGRCCMKTESIRVDPQIGLLLVQDSLPSAPPTSAACSTASLHEALPSVGAKQMLHGL
jgi:hypothetical protein